MPTIAERLLSILVEKNDLNIPSDINLEDPGLNIPNKVDFLLGSAVFWAILCPGLRKLGKRLPIIQNTYLGWIINNKVVIWEPTRHAYPAIRFPQKSNRGLIFSYVSHSELLV